MNLRIHATRLLLIVGIPAAVLCFQPRALADAASDNAKIDALLKQTGYSAEKKRDDVWVVHQQGSNLTDFKVVIATGDGLAVTFVTIARKKDVDLNSDFLLKLVKFNGEYDRIKVLIDDDGDIDVRIDSSIRVLDAAELKEEIHQVSTSADEIYGKIQGDLIH